MGNNQREEKYKIQEKEKKINVASSSQMQEGIISNVHRKVGNDVGEGTAPSYEQKKEVTGRGQMEYVC